MRYRRRWRVAIVGAGVAAQQHAAAIESVSATELVAVCEPLCSSAPSPAWLAAVPFRTLEEICADPAIDLVAVCTPPGTHGGIVELALHGGKAVVLEKPAAATLAEFKRIVAAAESAKRLPVGVMHQHRFALSDEAFSTRWSAEAVAVVEVYKFRSRAYFEQAPWRTDVALAGGGAFAHLGIHYADLGCQLLGLPTSVNVGAECRTYESIDSVSHAIVHFRSGANMVISCSSLIPGKRMRLGLRDVGRSLELADGAEVRIDGSQIRYNPPRPIPSLRAQVYQEVVAALEAGSPVLPRSDVRRALGAMIILETVRSHCANMSLAPHDSGG